MMTMERLRLPCGVLALSLLPVSVALAQSQETVTYYHTDAIGSVRMITDASGQVVARYDYLPFGEPWAPVPATSDARQFGGKERDLETGFDYFGARYYAGRIGRFTTPDSALELPGAMANPQRWNKYAYVSNNPLRKIDPDGRWERDVHYELTRVLARAAGFTPRSAESVAFANEFTDVNPATSPMGVIPWGPAVRRRESFHFTSSERRDDLWDDFTKSRNPTDLGIFLHAQQDSYSHGAFGAAFGQAPLLLGGPAVAKLPDKTWFIPSLADSMVQDTYRWLLIAAQMSGASSSVSWKRISPYVERFNRATSRESKREILNELQKSLEE
jgi:RHS repeat-associated protein